MRLILNAGFGALLGAPTLEELRQRGFSGIRQDIPDDATFEQVEALVREPADAGMRSLFICRTRPTAIWTAQLLTIYPGEIEWGNEECGKQHPVQYHRSLRQVWQDVRDYSPTLFTAGIVTPDRKRLGWLQQVYALGVPAEVHCAVHTYRQEKTPEQAHPGFKTRADEYRAIREIVGLRRRLIVSEIGWHSTKYTTGGFLGWFKRTAQLSDEQIANYAVGECEIAAENGVESLTYFQLNDGPDERNYEHRFGIRYQDGRWKPVADALERYANGI